MRNQLVAWRPAILAVILVLLAIGNPTRWHRWLDRMPWNQVTLREWQRPDSLARQPGPWPLEWGWDSTTYRFVAGDSFPTPIWKASTYVNGRFVGFEGRQYRLKRLLGRDSVVLEFRDSQPLGAKVKVARWDQTWHSIVIGTSPTTFSARTYLDDPYVRFAVVPASSRGAKAVGATCTVVGRVLSDTLNLPLIAQLFVLHTKCTAGSDSTGAFRIEGVPTGPIELQVGPGKEWLFKPRWAHGTKLQIHVPCDSLIIRLRHPRVGEWYGDEPLARGMSRI